MVHDAVLVLEGVEPLPPGASGVARAWVVLPDDLPHFVAPDVVATLLESDRIVGRATILELLTDPTPQPLADLGAARTRALASADHGADL